MEINVDREAGVSGREGHIPTLLRRVVQLQAWGYCGAGTAKTGKGVTVFTVTP